MSLEPYKFAKVVLIRSLSDLHPGTGRRGEIADLAVQRDGFGFPVIYGSSIKGSIKTALYYRDRSLINLLGPEPDDVEKYSSPIAMMTSYLLSFPVRSLKGIYTNVTSPFLLKRFADYLDMASILNTKYSEVAKSVKKIADVSGKFLATTDFKSRHVVEGLEKAILCEEISIDGDSIEERDEMNKLRELIGLDNPESLISLDDDKVKSLVERSLIRVTRIRIDRDRRTVAEGGLWTEEAVPTRTVFTTVFLGYSKEYVKKYLKRLKEGLSERKELKKLEELKLKELEELEKHLENKEPIDVVLEKVRYLIIGGDESIGRGIVELKEV